MDDDFSPELALDTIENSPIGVTIADARADDRPLVYVNDEFVELTGYPRQYALGRNCRFLQGNATRPEPVTRMRDAIATQQPVTVELRNYRDDGSMFWNQVSLRPIKHDDEVTHWLGFQIDVTERRDYEQEKTLFEIQAESVDKSILITDTEGRIEYVNPQFERTTGYSADEVIGRNPRLLKSGEHDEQVYEDLWETITAGEVWEAELTNKRKSGERYRVRQKIIPITNGGEISHFVGIEEDITDAEFIEEVLDVMNRILRHNVRNSVQAIDGYADLIKTLDDDQEQIAAVETIQAEAAKLEKISERTREIRELFRRRHTQHSLSVDTIPNFIQQRRDRHSNAVIELSMEIEEGVEIQNGSLLQLAIDEAVENAIVHNDTDEPHVEVTVKLASDTDEIVIRIADDGPGIPDSEWSAISAGRETPMVHGSGIGLWLMYWTLTALGGTVELSENRPRGSVLTYRVPLGVHEHVEGWDPTNCDETG